LIPKEKDFIRLAEHITLEECHRVVKKLGVSNVKWDDIQQKLLYDASDKRFLAFCSWSNQKEKERIDPTFQDLSDALNLAEVEDKHALCHVGNNCSHM
jgi:hypothetical protein